MQIMFNPKSSVNEYNSKGKLFSFPDLTSTLCPHCKKKHLKKHGFYTRYYISKDYAGHILIRRHICPECGRTISSIPYFCHPRRAYSTDFILTVLSRFFYRVTTISASLISFFSDYGVDCSRQLLYRYRKRFYENLTFLSMELFQLLCLNDYIYDKDREKRARQVISLVHHTAWTPLDVSMKLFLNSAHTYLTHLHFRV